MTKSKRTPKARGRRETTGDGRMTARTRRLANGRASALAGARRLGPAVWLGAAVLLALVAGAFFLVLRRTRGPAPTRPAANPAVLPDSPSPQEQALVRELRTARAGDSGPARRMGDFYVAAGQPFEALWAYALALHARPSDTPATLGLARSLEQGLLLEAAIARLRELLTRESGQPEASTRLAELYLRTGRAKEALAVVEEMQAAYRARGEGAVLEGRVREAVGDAAGAKRAYRRAVDQDAHDAAAWHRLGLLALGEGRLPEARQALARAHALDPAEPRYTVDQGRVTAAAGDAASQAAAMRLFQEAARAQPYAPAFYQAGLLLAAQNRLPQAAAAFGRATVADRNFAAPFRELARVLERTGRRADAHYQRGLYYSVRDLRPRSLREYLAMDAADPTRPDGLLMASQSLFKMQQTARAMTLARQARARFPGNREVREQFAALLILTTDRPSATQLCQEWLRDEPDAAQPRWMLGRIAADRLQFDEAIASYAQALARQPDNATFLESLGEVLLAAPGAEHLPRAVATLSRAVALAPQDARAHYQLGLALTRDGRLEEALRQMLRSLDLDPNRGPVYSTLVPMARRLRQPGPAALFAPIVRDVEERLREELALWRRTWDDPEEPAGYLALAHFLLRTGDPRRAESQLEQALELRPAPTRAASRTRLDLGGAVGTRPEAAAELARVRRVLAVVGPPVP